MINPDEIQPKVERIKRANTLTIRVEGREGHDAGVPLGSFLQTMKESLGMLADLSRELSNGRDSLDWRIIEASYTNPLMLVIEGRARNDGRQPQRVTEELVRGLTDLEQGRDPARFTVSSLRNAKSLAQTVSRDGISSFVFEAPNLPPIAPTQKTVISATKILKRRFYDEISTLEGTLETIDVHDKQVFGIFDPLTNDKIICHFDDSLRERVVAALTHRVSVEGIVRFKRSGVPVSIQVQDFEIMPGMQDLPQFDEGETLDITGGVSSEDYVRSLRDAE